MSREHENPPTPLPRGQIASVLLVQVCESTNVNVLFPFLAFMTEDLGYTGHQLGYYAGALAAAFCGGQVCSSIAWGMISDRYGRKFAIISGTIGAAVGMLIFGSSKVYAQAIAGRFIGGLLNGNIGIMKSFLTEFTDQSNRGKGFAYLSVASSVGSIIAPLCGGLLCNPAEKYPTLFRGGLFEEYPYLLPCVLVAIVNLLTALVSLVCMRETRHAVRTLREPREAKGLRSSHSLRDLATKHVQVVSVHYQPVALDERGAEKPSIVRLESPRAVSATHPQDEEDASSLDDTEEEEGEAAGNQEGKEVEKTAPVAVQSSHVLWQPAVLMTTGAYGLLAMAYIIYDETLPLFLKLDRPRGGVSFSSAQIGSLISLSGVLMLLFTVCALPALAAQPKARLFEQGVLGGVPLTLAWPLLAWMNVHVLARSPTHHLAAWALWPTLVLLATACRLFCTLSFTAVMLQVNQSVEEEHLGAVNGLGQSLAALARAVGPAAGGALWSLSVRAQTVAVNFVVTAVLLVVCGVINRHLPASLEGRKGAGEGGGGETKPDAESGLELSAVH